MDIRRAKLRDVERMLRWAAAEGWNPGLDDAAVFHGSDPDGFFLGSVDGQPIAAISVVNHNPDFAFLGLYIVHPDFRGSGHGKALWDAAIAHAGRRTIGLDGVPDQQANYRKSGFVHAGSTQRYQGKAAGALSPRLRLATPDDLAKLMAQEAALSGEEKPAYMRGWYSQTPHRQTFVLEDEGSIPGHVTLRRCVDGHKIGPLCAETPEIAATLLDHCFALTDGTVSIDVPQASQSLAGICQGMGLTVSFETARMYRGAPPAGQPGVFAVTSLELG